MAFIDSPEATRIAGKISDGTVTIKEFIEASIYEITNKGRHQGDGSLLTRNIQPLTNTLEKALPKLNLDLNSPWSSLLDRDVLKDFDDLKEVTSNTLVHIQVLEREAEDFYDNHKRLIDNPNIYPYASKTTMISGQGNLYRKKVGAKKGSQVRGTDKLKGVPKTEATISKLLGVVNKMPSDDPKNVKAAVLFNILMPYRPGEVAGLRLSDIDFEEGVIAEWSRGQKTRNNLVLSKTALAILKDAAEKAKDHPANKGVNDMRIFPTLTSANMTAALNKADFKKDFAVHEATLGRPLKGVKDLRKLIPSLLAHELGANIDVVSEILGHKDIGDINMSLAHYISPVQTNELSSTRALRTLENLIGFHVGAATLNDVPTIFGVSADADFVNSKDVIDIEDPRDFRASEVAVDRPVTPEDIERREKFLARQDARVLQQTEEALLGAEQAKTDRLTLAKEINPQKVADAQLAKIDEKAAVNKILQEEYAKIDAIAPEDRDPIQVNRHAELSRQLKVKPEATARDLKFLDNVSTEEILNRPLKSMPTIIRKGAKGTAKALPYLMFGGVGLAAKTAEAAIDVATEPSRIGGILEYPEDASEAELLNALQQGATREDLTPASAIAIPEMRSRIEERRPIAELSDDVTAYDLAGVSESDKMQAQRYIDEYEPPIKEAVAEEDESYEGKLLEEYQGFFDERSAIST